MNNTTKLKIVRYAITPSKTNRRSWCIVAVIEVNGEEQTGPIRCHADSKRQAKMLKEQFNAELRRR